jgi:hypothetical protein
MPYQYLQALNPMLSHLNSMQPDFTKKLIQESFTHMKTTQNTGNSLIIRGKINSGSFSPPPTNYDAWQRFRAVACEWSLV